jgi:hypothetical protein
MNVNLWTPIMSNGDTPHNLFIIIGENLGVMVTVTVFPSGGNRDGVRRKGRGKKGFVSRDPEKSGKMSNCFYEVLGLRVLER